MASAGNALDIVVYQDVLCARCHIALNRIEMLRIEFGDIVRWSFRPFPLRIEERPPTEEEIRRYLSDIRLAKRAFKGAPIVGDLWTGRDRPRSTVPAMVAIEAARLQGNRSMQMFSRALRRAAFEQGLNVTRTDILFEIASRLGLEMNRFEAVCKAPETRQLILDEQRFAAGRGVEVVPTLVLGNRWMISGLQSLREYRQRIVRCLKQSPAGASRVPSRVLH